jgi:hypothetical protein
MGGASSEPRVRAACFDRHAHALGSRALHESSGRNGTSATGKRSNTAVIAVTRDYLSFVEPADVGREPTVTGPCAAGVPGIADRTAKGPFDDRP